jgi:two-component system, OmpR family, osmolarity sensor histidine kinase EnvZ
VRILPAIAPPPEDRGYPTLLERQFVRAFARQMAGEGVIVWRGGMTGQLWVRVELGNIPYWISYERPQGVSPAGGIIISALVALLLSLFAGILLQRRIGEPLQRLARAADAIGAGRLRPSLSEGEPTEIAAVAHSFNLMGQRLAEQENDRRFMLAGISHDLRTPLAKIRLALALQPVADPETSALVDRQLDRVDAMLGQFLDFARGIDAEEPKPLALTDAVRSAVALVDADPPIAVTGQDCGCAMLRPVAFERAIINLVRNALCYGAAPIEVIVGRSGKTGRIVVRDHGPGVDPALLGRIAEPFVRGDGARPNTGSTGLGLAIVRRIVDQHHGELVLQNRAQGGFEAIITIPIAENGSGHASSSTSQ